MKTKLKKLISVIMTAVMAVSVFGADLISGRSVALAATATVTNTGGVSYGPSFGDSFMINGKRAYCVMHNKLSLPSGTAVTSSSCTNANILRLLYYGPTGPKRWSGFNSLTEGQGIVAISKALSYVYCGTSLGVGSAFYNYAMSQPAPFTGSPTISISPSSTGSSVVGTMLQSGMFTYSAASGNKGYCTIPSGYEGHNKTQNVGSPAGATMVLNPGDVFFFKKTNTTAATQTFTIKGTGSFSANYWTPSNSSYQTLVLANGVGTADSKAVTVKFEADGKVRFHKTFESDDEDTMKFFKEFMGYKATFTVYSDSAMTKTVKSATTGTDYYTPYLSLSAGTYYYKETAVTGAMIKNSRSGSFTVKANESKTIDESATKNDGMSGRIEAVKVKKEDGKVVSASDLGGATFNVYYNHDKYPSITIKQSNDGQKNTVTVNDTKFMKSGTISSMTDPAPTLLIGTLTSDSDGKLKVTSANTFVRTISGTSYSWTAAGFNTYSLGATTGGGNLPAGYYTIVETKAPTSGNYTTSISQYKMDFSEDALASSANNSSYVIDAASGTFKWTPSLVESDKARITLTKTPTMKDNDLYSVAGAEYTIYVIDGLMTSFLDPESSSYVTVYAELLGNAYEYSNGKVLKAKTRQEMYDQLERMLQVTSSGKSDGNILYYDKGGSGRLQMRYITGGGVDTNTTPPFYCSKVAKFRVNEDGIGIVSEIIDESKVAGGLNTDTLQLKNDGTKIYFAVETKVPDSGAYAMSEEYDYAIAKSGDAAMDFTETDNAFMDPLVIEIRKDSSSDTQAENLTGTVFEIDYYDGYYNSMESLPSEVTKKWFIETKYNAILEISRARFEKSYLASDPDFAGLSSEFEYDPTSGNVSMPLGTITVREVKSARGFNLNSGTIKDQKGVDYTANDRTFIGQVKMVDGKATLMGASNASAGTITFTNKLDETLNLDATNSPVTAEFGMTKLAYNPEKDADEPVGGINFKVTQLNSSDLSETGKSYSFTTSQDGTYYSFNDEEDSFDDDSNGCLVPGYTYKVEELMDTEIAKKYQKVDDIYMEVILNEGVISIAKKDDDGNVISTTTVKDAVESDKGVVYYYDLGKLFNYPNPELSTMEVDGTTGLHTTPNSDEAVILDTISWKYLDCKSDWTIKGILMKVEDDGTVSPLVVDGSYVMNHVFVSGDDSYKPTESRYERTGYAEMEFKLNANLCKGTQFVVYEYLFKGKDDSDLTVKDGTVDTSKVFQNSAGNLVSHAVYDDASQTGYIPEIGTQAQDAASETKLVYAGGNATITDTVTYKRLDPNDDNGYVLVAELVDKEDTGKIYATKTSDVIKGSKNGEVKMDLSFDASLLAGHTLVVYEYLYHMPEVSGEAAEFNRETATLIATHADSEDKNQTVYVPSVGTKVGQTTYTGGKSVKVTDTVSYTNLLKGYDYTLAAELKVLDDKGNVIATITPKDGLKNFTVSGTKDEQLASGSQKVTFTFDATGFADRQMVVYERLYIGKFATRASLDETKLVGAHEDSTDKNQTFEFDVPLNIEKKNEEGLIIGGAKMEIWTADGKTCLEAWETVEGKAHETTIRTGEYILREVEAPFGYALADDVKFTVNANCEVVVDGQVMADNLITMVDKELSMLPSTGSRGAMSLSVLGLSMMLVGALALVRKKRRQ